jgi:hypothetical protein
LIECPSALPSRGGDVLGHEMRGTIRDEMGRSGIAAPGEIKSK